VEEAELSAGRKHGSDVGRLYEIFLQEASLSWNSNKYISGDCTIFGGPCSGVGATSFFSGDDHRRTFSHRTLFPLTCEGSTAIHNVVIWCYSFSITYEILF
jgi:hypothetical protein